MTQVEKAKLLLSNDFHKLLVFKKNGVYYKDTFWGMERGPFDDQEKAIENLLQIETERRYMVKDVKKNHEN